MDSLKTKDKDQFSRETEKKLWNAVSTNFGENLNFFEGKTQFHCSRFMSEALAFAWLAGL